MLPSKGFFNNFNCPFNEYDVCNRPHCHYRHFRKKKQKPEENGGGNAGAMLANFSSEDVNTLLFSELISEAVQNLLNKSKNVLGSEEEDKASEALPLPLPTSQPESTPVPTYKPTPISELSRRHLPTLYVPSRAEPRKTKADGSSESTQPIKKKRVQEYRPKPTKKLDQPIPEYCPSAITSMPESQISALAEELSFLDNIFDDKDLLESEEGANQAAKTENISKPESVNFEPRFSSDEEENDSDKASIPVESEIKENECQSSANIDISRVKEEPEDSPKVKEKKDSSKNEKKEDSKKKDSSSSKKHSSSHSRSKSSSSRHSSHSSRRSVDKKDSRKSHHSSSSRHKSSSRTKDDKNRHSSTSSKSSRHKSSSSGKHRQSSKDRRSSTSSRSKSKSSSKKSSSSSRDKKYENHVCDCKYCPTNKKKTKKSETESEAEESEQTASENESSSAESVIYCSPERTKIEIISSSDEEAEEREGQSMGNDSNSEPDNDEENSALPDLSDGEGTSSGGEDLLAKQVFEKFKGANFKPVSAQTESINQSGSKKRVAYDSVANATSSWPQDNYNAPKIHNKGNDSLTPAQLMAQRWEKIQQLKNAAPPNPTGPQSPAPGKMRIAHVPNVSSLIERKKQLIEQRVQPYPSNKPQPPTNSSLKANSSKAESDKLSAQEVFALLKRQLTGNHEKVTEHESKVGVEALTLAYAWLYDNAEEAHEKAVELEKTVSNAAHQVITYRRALFLKIKNIADQAKEIEKNGRSAVLTFNTYSFTYGHNLYLCFAKFLMSEEDLDMYGYPRPHENYGCALISENVLRKDPPYSTDSRRVCEKCAEPYTVDEDGYPIEGIGKCIYHARKGFIRNRTNRHHEDVRHKCCRQEKGSPGCITSKYHASHNVDPKCLTGFITLRDPPDDGEKENNVYALDCEMVFTTKGRELARLTIIDVKLRTVFDKLIKPKGALLDCITQWSGITEADLKTATVSFEEVQRYVKKLFNSKTILVGHGLENDLRSMKVLHDKIVDTSVVFPHKYAPQMKESLQKLAEQFLQKLIQTGEETLGHSSEEDARTCMELMLMKIKEDCKQYAPKKVVNLNISRR
ncbi:uncharacterized protein [Bemisia tabaci]|uniref:uncharacterized protein n=1 Tax=Bemisia tabaci TaxID=7038 RepID=UPI003B281D40